MRVSAALDGERLSVSPGDQVSTVVTVRNASDTVEAYLIDVVGVPQEWVLVDRRSITLYPATSGTITITFRPPRSPRPGAGEVAFGVRVVPSEHPAEAILEEGTLLVEPYAELTARLEPESRDARRSTRFAIKVENQGNVSEALRFFAADGAEELVFATRPARAVVANGDRVESRLKVKTRELTWWGEPRPIPFTVRIERVEPADPAGHPATSAGRDAQTVELDSRPTIELHGTFVRRPIISAGLLKLLAALLALLLALLALWFGLLRPTLRSAAREAVDDAAADRAAREQAEAGRGGPTPEPSASAGADGQGGGARGGGQSPGGSGGSQFSTAVSFRTSPNGSATRGFTVPEGKVFLVTDFLVDNAQGDEGTLTVTANQVQVVTFALENFRNQDYHSVTPIRVPGGAQVTLTVVCRRPGTPANASQATTCLESLYLNGIMTDGG